MSSFAPPPAPPQTVVQDLSIVPLGVTPNMETPVGTEIAVLQAGPPVGIGTPLTTRMPTSAGAPASVTSETIESGPTNEEMRAPTLVTRQKRPSAALRIWKTTPRDGEGTADTSSDSSSESGAESTSDWGYERMSTDSPQISPPRTPRRRRCGAARMTSMTLTPNRTVRRKGKYIAFCPYTCQCWLCYQSLLISELIVLSRIISCLSLLIIDFLHFDHFSWGFLPGQSGGNWGSGVQNASSTGRIQTACGPSPAWAWAPEPKATSSWGGAG